MAKYLIHTCKKRLWYVEQYLIPSMRKQGIKKKDIYIYNDKTCEGQLKSLYKSCEVIDEDVWHLQDDIIISTKFKELTEKYDEGLVCGFCNCFSKGRPGYVGLESMWYSMPCIRIPNDIFKRFISWMKSPEIQRRLQIFFEENKHDDVFLQIFLKENYPNLRLWNLAPNLVNHIDYLLGGSLINQGRSNSDKEIMSKYWDEPALLIAIEQELNANCG